jgi:cell division protein FtsB
MRTRQKRTTRLGRLVVPTIALAFLGYLSLQAQSGRYGLDAKAELTSTLALREAELKRVTKEREAMEQRVRLLHDGTLERDMIDERARSRLNYGAEDEIVILR